jgi:hypothetical protein
MEERPAWPCLTVWVARDPVRACQISTTPQKNYHKALVPFPADPLHIKSLHSNFMVGMQGILESGNHQTLDYIIDRDLDRMSKQHIDRLYKEGKWPSIRVYLERINDGKTRVSLSPYAGSWLPKSIPLPADAMELRALYLDISWAIGYVTGKSYSPSAISALDRNPKRRGRPGLFLEELPRYVDIEWRKSTRGHISVPNFPDAPSEAVQLVDFSIGQPGTGRRQ